MNLPTQAECKHLILTTFRVPANIVNHSILVNKVAVFLAKRLEERNVQINIDLVDRASILHDMLKIIEINNAEILFQPPGEKNAIPISKKDRMVWIDLKKRFGIMSHEEAAYIILKEKYPELATVIKKHGYHDQTGENKLNTWEEKIVNYADKRVAHTNIVTLKERFEEGHKRYAKKNLLSNITQEYQERADKTYFDLEKEIFKNLNFNPDKLKEELEKYEQE